MKTSQVASRLAALFYVSVLAGALAQAQPSSCVNSPSGMVSWWRGENNPNDSMGGNLGILRNGAGFVVGAVGNSLNFSGINDCVEIPHSASLITTNYTIETWVKPAAQVSDTISQDVIFGQAYGYCQLVARPGTTGVRIVWQFGTNPFNFPEVQSATEIPIGQFSHLAGTWDGVTLRLYINGVLNAQSSPGAVPADSGCPFFIGGFYNTNANSCGYVGQFFNGAIDEVSFYNRALASNEIAGVFLAGSAGKCAPNPPPVVCAPAPAGLVSWWKAENDATDPVNGNNGTLQSGTTFVPGEVGHGFIFNGTNSYVEVPDAPSLRLTNELTIEFWVKRRQPFGSDYIVNKGGDWTGGVLNYGVAIAPPAYGNILHFTFAGGIRGTVAIADLNWHHCAVVARHGDSDVKFYVDGVFQSTTHFEGAGMVNLHPSTQPLRIGAQIDPPIANYFSKTLIDELSIYNRALSSNEIVSVFLAGSAGKCAPTNPPPPQVVAVPAITSFNPTVATVSNSVIIAGTNFSPVAANNIVYFGAVQAGVTAASSNSLTVTVPVGATHAPITVTVGGLTAAARAAFTPTFAGGAAISTASFSPRVNLGVGDGPTGTAIADLDGDGKPDITVTDDYGHTVSVFRNISVAGTLDTGSFAPRVVLPASLAIYSPYMLVTGDVDGDGKLDLITTDIGGNTVSVYRNQAAPGSLGVSSFAPFVSFVVGAGPRAVALLDLDADGRPEIVTANYDGSTISVLRNTSAPGQISSNSFAPRFDLPAGAGAHGLAVTDLDGDGRPDLATANAIAGSISLFRNVGGGAVASNSFAPVVTISGPNNAHFLRAADLDGDGRWELLLTSYLGQTLTVYRNQADPGVLNTNSFAAGVTFPLAGRGHTIALGDLNGDTKLDIAVDTEIGDSIALFQNQSTAGSFTSASLAARVDLAAGWNAWGSSVGDLDGDGRPDIIFANTYDDIISIYRNVVPITNPPPASCTAAPSGLVSWWRAEGTALDSTTGNHGAPNSATPFASTGLAGQAFKFNGLADKIDLGDPQSLRLTNAFTIEAWILASNAPSGPHSQILFRGDTRHCLDPYYFSLQPNRAIRLHVAANDPLNPCGVDLDTAAVPLNQWMHVAGVFDGDAGRMSIYIDGTLAAQLNTSVRPFAELDPASSPAVVIGNTIGFTDQGFNGLIDELSVYNRVLGSNEIAGIFLVGSAGKCPATNPPPVACANSPSGLISWWRAEQNAVDALGNNSGQALNGVGFTNGPVGAAFYFDGGDDRVIVSNSASLNFGLGADFSIEAWIKPEVVATAFGVQSIANKRYTPNSSTAVGWEFGLIDGKLFCQMADAPLTAGDFSTFLSAGPDLRDGNYHHVAVMVQRGNSTGGKLVVDGQVVLTFDPTLQPGDLGTTEPLRIGAHSDAVLDSHFTGGMDEVSIYNRALTITEIQAIASAGSAGKCSGTNLPVTCIPSLPDIVGWWRAEGNAVDSIAGNNGVFQGAGSYAQGQVGQAFILNGEGAGVRIAAASALDVGTQAGLTAEAWIYPTNVTSGGPIIEWSRDIGGSPYGAHLWAGHPSRSPGFFFANLADTDGNWRVIEKDGALVANTYQHVAVTYDRITGIARLFVNGAMVQESNLGIFTPRTSDHLFIGRRPTGDINNYSFAGQIDEVGIYRRALTPAEILAIYNANSSGKCPPTALPPGIAQQPQSIITNVNANVRFDVVATGIPAPSYQWFFASNALSGQTGASLLLNNVQPGQAGEYFVIATNNFGAVTSSVATLTVLTFPPVITRQPTNLTVIESATASFSVQATGSVMLAYQWLFNDAPLAGKTAAALALSNVQFSNAGNYSVIVTNPYGAATSSVATLTVNPRPPCAPVHDGLVSWWRGENNALDGWDSNNGVNNNQNYPLGKVGRAFFGAFVTVPDTHDLRVTNAMTLEAWVNPSSVSGNTPRIIVSKYEYPFAQPNGTQSAYLLGTTNNGLLFFTVSPMGSVRTNITLVTSQALPINQWSHVAATYDGSALRIYLNGTPAAQTNYSSGIFPGAVNFSIGGIPSSPLGASAAWPFTGLLDEVSLYNRALSASEIQSIFNADLTGKCLAPPVITQQPQDQSVPLGEDVRLTASVFGSRPVTYRWKLNGTNIPNATNAFLLIERIKTNQAGLYSLAVTNSVGFDLSTPAQISLLPAPSCTGILPGLVSWWPGDSNTLDVVGLNSLGGFSPRVFATGKVASAFSFNGIQSRITVGNTSSLNFNSNANFSIEMWIKANATNAFYPNVPLLEKRSTSNPLWVGYSLSLNQGRLAFAIGSGINPLVSSFISPGPDLRDAMFHHVAVTVNRTTTNGGVLYVDGVPVLTFDPTPRNGSLVNTSQLSIGAPTVTLSNSYFAGLIDEPAIYNRDLTAAEVLSIRTAGAAGRCKSPPVIVTQPVGGSVTNGESIALSVVADGPPTLRYQWRRNNLLLAGATNAALLLTNINSTNAGRYSVIVSNVFGSILSLDAVVVVNRIPTAFPGAFAVNEDASTEVVLNGTDPDGNPLNYIIVTPPTNGILSGPTFSRFRIYTPSPNYHGPDSFTYKVNDGFIDSTNAIISITVRSVNDAPVAQSQIVRTDEDIPVNIALQASDLDGDALAYELTQPTHGTLSGTAPNLIYTPHTNYFGDDLFTFTVRDGSNAVSQLAAVSITVRPINDAPVAKIAVSPLDELPGITNLVVIAPVCCLATLRLDASESSDVENDSLTYLWLAGTNVLSTAVTTTNRFQPGTHEITLLVSDGREPVSKIITVEIITSAEAVEFLKCLVEEGITERRTRTPLVNWLRQAEAAFERCHVEQGVHFLEMFQQRVHDRITQVDPELATSLIETTEAIIEAAPDCDPCHRLGRPGHKGGKHQERDERQGRPEGRSSGR